jgi:hypothetical protein
LNDFLLKGIKKESTISNPKRNKMTQPSLLQRVIKKNQKSPSLFPLEEDHDKLEGVRALSEAVHENRFTEEEFWKAILNLDLIDRERLPTEFFYVTAGYTDKVREFMNQLA